MRQQARRGNFNICLTLRSNTAARAACPNAGDSPNARTKIVGGLAIFRGNIRKLQESLRNIYEKLRGFIRSGLSVKVTDEEDLEKP